MRALLRLRHAQADDEPGERLLAWDRAPEFGHLPSADRRMAERLFRGCLQNVRLIDSLLKRSGLCDVKKIPPPTRWVLRMLVYERLFLETGRDYAATCQAVELAKSAAGERAGGFVNAIGRKLAGALPPTADQIEAWWRSATGDSIPPEIQNSFPDDIARALASGYGEAAMPDIMRAMNEEETRVWMRVNTLRTTPEKLSAELTAAGVPLESVPGLEQALRWTRTRESGPGAHPVRPWSTEPWARGEITVQDLGAMLAASALAPAAGEIVIDWCAAPGGKTGQMYEMTGARARLAALEISPARREAMREALHRLYGAEAAIAILSSVEEVDSWLAALGGPDQKADAILVDAPCLALGLARRRPEVRWDKRLNQLERIQRAQTEIVTEALARLAPGGRLVYVTCSPTRAENEDVIRPILQADTSLELGDPAARFPAAIRAWVDVRDGFARTRPDKAPVDAFCFCLIRRQRA